MNLLQSIVMLLVLPSSGFYSRNRRLSFQTWCSWIAKSEAMNCNGVHNVMNLHRCYYISSTCWPTWEHSINNAVWTDFIKIRCQTNMTDVRRSSSSCAIKLGQNHHDFRGSLWSTSSTHLLWSIKNVSWLNLDSDWTLWLRNANDRLLL